MVIKMKPNSDFEDLINHFSEKIKFEVTDIYPSECFILILVKPKRKYKKGIEDNQMKIYLNFLKDKLKKFTGFDFCIIVNNNMFISAVGNLLFSGCNRKPDILSLRPRRKK